MKRTLIHIHHTLWVTAIVVLVLFAAIFTSVRIVSPWVVEQKPAIEKWAGQLFQHPVHIEKIAIRWRGLEPTLRCTNLTILNEKNQRPSLKIGQADIGINIFRSIFNGEIRLGHIRISDLHLTVRENPDDSFSISGIDTPLAGDNADSDQKGTDEIVTWLLTEPRVSLHNVNVTWYGKDKKVLPIEQLELRLRNDGAQHKLWGQAKLAQATPSQVYFVITAKGDWHDKNDFTAKIYIKAQDILLEQWLQDKAFENYKIGHGITDFQIWGTWQNKHWQKWQSTFAITETVLTPIDRTQNNSAITIQQLSANVLWQPQGRLGWQLTADNINLTLANQTWPTNQFSLTVTQTDSNQPKQEIWQLGYLNIAQATQFLLSDIKLPAKVQEALTQLKPKGELQKIALTYQADTAVQTPQFLFTGEFKQLQFNRWEKIPGINNLSGQLQLTEKSGSLNLTTDNVILDFGNLFRAPLPVNELNGQINWQNDEKGWTIKSSNLTAKNPDAVIEANVALQIPADHSSPVINLLGGYHFTSAEHIQDYLPISELSPDLTKWLSNSVKRFESAKGTLILHGALKDYPFENNNGQFVVDADIEDGDLAYWPEWPMLQHFSGELVFAGRSMHMDATEGQILSSKIKKVIADIPVLKKGVHAILTINGELTGELNDSINFVQQSPLKKITKSGLDHLKADGSMDTKVSLIIPLEHGDPIKVNGALNTEDATLTLTNLNLALNKLQGTINFNEDGLTAKQVTGSIWNKPVNIDITTFPKPNGMQIKLTGNATIQDVQQQFKWKILDSFNGAADYTVLLNVGKNTGDNLQVISDLKGVAVNLPKPFVKPVDVSQPFKLTANLSGDDPFSEFDIDYNNWSGSFYQNNQDWVINFKGPFAAGQVVLPENKTNPIQANLRRLYLDDTTQQDSKKLNPQELPSLRLRCQDFRYKGKQFGTINLSIDPLKDGIVINQLQANSDAYNLTASGFWRGNGSTNASSFKGVLTSTNIAKALTNWGFPNGFSSKQTKINFDLNWPAVPYAPNFESIQGKLGLRFEKGNIAAAGGKGLKSDFGRLITITSWQSIARRLHLDFSDLTNAGYSFDIFQGNFELNDGYASTQDTYLDGPVAKIVVKGDIDLVDEEYNLEMVVTPHVSSSLSFLAGFAGGPVVGIAAGAASWVATKVFSEQMGRIVEDTYKMTGPWSDPIIKQTNGIWGNTATQKK